MVDGDTSEVRRYLPDWKPDASWNFQSRRNDGTLLLARSEGIAIDEKNGTLFLTSEREGLIYAFNLETGEWLGKTIGRQTDSNGKPIGQSVFQRSVEGLAIIGDYLLAVDEGNEEHRQIGHLLIFDLRSDKIYETGAEQCISRRNSGITAGLIGWLGRYNSPDAVAVFNGNGESDAMVAIADQSAYQVLVYSWKDILYALNENKKNKP
ncbi:MAG: hypothetical protein EOM73_13530 [Bacteroidia bacterium]|nr:hypothetical protein [Bacteroidia bacterium]